MFKKMVILHIFCIKKPNNIKILTNDDCLVNKTTIKSKRIKICICTNSCYVKLFVKYKNQIVCKKVLLNKCKYQNVFVNFNFDKIIQQKIASTITLQDANFGFPIKNAILRFQQN